MANPDRRGQKRRTTGALALVALIAAGCGKSASNPPPAQRTAAPSSAVLKSSSPNVPFLALNPASGPPGTLVTVTGYLPSMRSVSSPNQKYPFQGYIAFGGLARGLTITVSSYGGIHWSRRRPGHFTTVFRVPRTAWLTPAGPHALTPGRYPVAITCVGNTALKGCAAGPDQARAQFVLTGVTARSSPKAWLKFSPAAAAPGQRVSISGWAPLTEIIGHPFGYQLVWYQNGRSSQWGSLGTVSQSFSGRLTGSFRVPASLAGLGPVKAGSAQIGLQYLFLGHKAPESGSSSQKVPLDQIFLAKTSFHVLPALAWEDLGHVVPLRLAENINPIAVAGSQVAAITPATGELWVSDTAGATWHPVSLAGIAAKSQTTGYPTHWSSNSSKPMVHSVTLNPAFPSSIFVTVSSIKKQYGSAPPLFFTPYVTTDGGATWRPVPVLPGFSFGDFGGFHVQGSRVYAEWIGPFRVGSEYTDNGGRSWTAGMPECPSRGPCLRFGPLPDKYPGMGALLIQPVWRKTPQGWTKGAEVSVTGQSQLAALSSHDALLIDPTSNYPVQLTTDGGLSWRYVALPPIPGAISPDPFFALLLLPDGTFLAEVTLTTDQTGWYRLPFGTSQWQALPKTVLPAQAQFLTLSGQDLWWIPAASNPSKTSGPPPVRKLSVSQVSS